MGASPRVVSVLKEGYNLPFKNRPLLTRNAKADMPILSGTATYRGIAFPFTQADHRVGQGSILSGLLQLPLLGSQAQQQVASRPQLTEQIPEHPNL